MRIFFQTLQCKLNQNSTNYQKLTTMRNLIIIALVMQIGCTSQEIQTQMEGVQIVNVSNWDSENFNVMRETFKERNPGYDMMYLTAVHQINETDSARVVFVQEIGGITNQDVLASAIIRDSLGAENNSEAIVGDILILKKGENLQFDTPMGLLVFNIPEEPDQKLPSFIRPDWDPNITDVPGGCATDIDAYRRILLTWQKEVGEYIYHAINSHRVRIYDSFSHYHPVEGGFDEFYLVQMIKPGAKIITSERVDLITKPDQVEVSQAELLIDEYELEIGDLVYLPRGVMHRGFGGVLAQVITIPGFIPGSEIGVDHHLRSINERFDLDDNSKIPFNEEHSHEQVIR